MVVSPPAGGLNQPSEQLLFPAAFGLSGGAWGTWGTHGAAGLKRCLLVWLSLQEVEQPAPPKTAQACKVAILTNQI